MSRQRPVHATPRIATTMAPQPTRTRVTAARAAARAATAAPPVPRCRLSIVLAVPTKRSKMVAQSQLAMLPLIATTMAPQVMRTEATAAFACAAADIWVLIVGSRLVVRLHHATLSVTATAMAPQRTKTAAMAANVRATTASAVRHVSCNSSTMVPLRCTYQQQRLLSFYWRPPQRDVSELPELVSGNRWVPK